MTWEAKKTHDAVELVTSGARTSTGAGSAVRLPPPPNALVLVLDVTAAATDEGDACAVYVQTKCDSTNWVDVHRFNLLRGNGGAKRYYAKLLANTATTEFENGTALTPATSRHLLGDEWRVRWVITEGGVSASGSSSATATGSGSGSGTQGAGWVSFTFSVYACPC